MKSHPLLTAVRSNGNPVIEGSTATFVWEGKTAPHLIDDSHDWEENPLPLEKAGPGVWVISLTLPPDAYLEYSWLNPETKERLEDPFNPEHYLWNGVNAYNYYFYMPEAAPTPLAQRQKGVPRGEVTIHSVETDGMAVGKKRQVYLYQPPTDDPAPLLVVYDGPDYLRRGKLAVIVDNLIAQKRIPPVAMALVQHGKDARTLEYACSELTLGFIAEKVVGLAQANLNLIDFKEHPGAYGVMGASMGGLMAMYTGLRLPAMFGKVLSQSGAFSFPRHEFITSDIVRHMPNPGIKMWLDVGTLEWLLRPNRQFRDALQENGYDFVYREYNGGHNYTSWRNDLWRGLGYLFGYFG